MAMRIRLPFAGSYFHCHGIDLSLTHVIAAFLLLVLLAAYVGLTSLQIPQVNDKILHFFTFFLFTVSSFGTQSISPA